MIENCKYILFVGPELSTSMSLSTMFQKSRAWSISWRSGAWSRSRRPPLSWSHQPQPGPADSGVSRVTQSRRDRKWFLPEGSVRMSQFLELLSTCMQTKLINSSLPRFATRKAGMSSGRSFLLFLVHDLRSEESRVLRNVKCWQLREINVSYIWARVFRQRLARCNGQ